MSATVPPHPRRIAILGSTGAGKSTLARRLGDVLRLPIVELDDLHFDENWATAPLETFRRRVERATASETWIAVGNYSKTRDLTWDRADLVIWLDYGWSRCLVQLGWRTSHRIVRRTRVCNGNVETLGRTVSKDSLLLWFFESWPKKRREYERLFLELRSRDVTLVRLRSPRETRDFLAGLARVNGANNPASAPHARRR